MKFFEAYRDLFLRWYENPQHKTRFAIEGLHKHPDTGAPFTHESLKALFETAPLEQQFGVFFPKLAEDNWEGCLNSRAFEPADMPY